MGEMIDCNGNVSQQGIMRVLNHSMLAFEDVCLLLIFEPIHVCNLMQLELAVDQTDRTRESDRKGEAKEQER